MTLRPRPSFFARLLATVAGALPWKWAKKVEQTATKTAEQMESVGLEEE